MTNSATMRALGACGLLLASAALATGCSETHRDGDASSSGSHWLTCAADRDCSAKLAGTHCGEEGVCLDAKGERVKDPRAGGAAGSHAGAGDSGSGSAGTSSAGGSSAAGRGGSGSTAGASGGATGGKGGSGGAGGTYLPCAGKRCGDACTLCDPKQVGCVETDVVKSCDGSGACVAGSVVCSADAGTAVALPDCSSSAIGASEGSACGARDDQPIPECCSDSAHLRCAYDACTGSIPASCHGTFERVVGSKLCGGYQPCAGKSCGDGCTLCEPGDPACSETADIKACDRNGVCMGGGAPDCAPPPSCNPEDVGSCGAGMACCAVGRCGPIVIDQGQCEEADPKTGGCTVCACESQPGGCPICNSPDTPIATPDGERAIADLREGDLVLSMDRGQLVAVPIVATRSVRVFNHAVVHLVLDNGRVVEISGSHPTADGRRLDALQPGDALGDAHVEALELVPYRHERTYDILPASDSGTYLAGGALIGSTLFVRGSDGAAVTSD